MKALFGTVAIVGVFALAVVALSPRSTDRVKEACLMGDLLYETRDGTYGFVDGAPECQPAP